MIGTHENLAMLLARFTHVLARGGSHTARCPHHEDNKNSLSIRVGDNGGIVLHCHAGCKTEDVLAAAGCEWRDVLPSEGYVPSGSTEVEIAYDYNNERGELLYQVVRKPGKEYRQRRPDGKGGWVWNLQGVTRYPYRLFELLESQADVVFVPEGEKDVETLRKHGLTATCNAGGAGKWTDSLSQWLRGRNVVILPDNDDPGREHAEKVTTCLKEIATSVQTIELPGLKAKGDVTDWLNGGNTPGDLMEMLNAPKASDSYSMDELLHIAIDQAGKSGRVFSTGILRLDASLNGGIAEKELFIIGGLPGHAKSLIAEVIAVSFASQGLPGLCLQLDMKPETQANRILQASTFIKKADWSKHRPALRQEARERLKNLAHVEYVYKAKSADHVWRMCKAAKEKFGARFVVLDYLQYLAVSSKPRPIVEGVVRVLRRAANELGMVAIGLSQLNRDYERRCQARRKGGNIALPCNADLAETPLIEREADGIFFTVCPSKIDPRIPSSNDHILLVTKNRDRGFVYPVVSVRVDGEHMSVEKD